MTIPNSLAVAVFALCTVAVIPAMAQSTSMRSGVNQSNSASATAGKAVSKAQAELGRLQTDLGKIKARVRSQILAKPEWAQVTADRKSAETALDSVRKSALDALHNTANYKALSKSRDDAHQIVNAHDAVGSQISQGDFDNASNAFVSDGIAMKKMEADALKDDAKYAAASTQLEAANARMKEADGQVELALKDDPEYQNAAKQLESAKTALTAARAQLAQARQQEEQTRFQQAKVRQQQQQQGGGGGGGGGRGY
jgi:hypothetical protein